MTQTLPGATTARLLVIGALVALLLVVLPTWQPKNIRLDTLDGGYRAVLNDGSLTSLEFGTELVSTTGPLGFLRNRDYWPGRFVPKMAWDMLIALAFCATIGLALRQRSVSACLFFGIAFVVSAALVRFDIYRLTNCLPVLYVWSRISDDGRLRRAASFLTLTCLAIGAWVLFSNLVLFTAVVVATEGAIYLRSRRTPKLGLLYAVLVIVLWIVTGNRIAALRPYISNSLEIARGYTEVMLRPGGFIGLLPGSLAAIALVISIFATEGKNCRRPRADVLLLAAAAAAIFYISFRSAFVRFEASRALEFYVVVALWALFSILRTTADQRFKRSTLVALLAYLLALGGGIALVVRSPKIAFGNHVRLTLQTPGLQASALVTLVTERSRQREGFEKNIAEIRKRFPLDHLEGPIDMHGNLQGIIIANDLDYRPRPVFQSFTAYTPKLIRLNDEFLQGGRAPATVIVEMRRALGYPEGLLDAGAWLQLFEFYEPQEILEGGFGSPPEGLLVARRRAVSHRLKATKITSGTYPFGTAIEVPPEHIGDPIWAVVEDTQTPLGRLGTTFLKLPIILIDLDLRDGKHWTFKFSTSPARSGFLLSPQVRSVHEIRDLMTQGLDHAPPRRIVTSVVFRQQETYFSSLVRRGLRVTLYALSPPDAAGQEK